MNVLDDKLSKARVIIIGFMLPTILSKVLQTAMFAKDFKKMFILHMKGFEQPLNVSFSIDTHFMIPGLGHIIMVNLIAL